MGRVESDNGENKQDPVERLPHDLCLHLFEYLLAPCPEYPVRPATSRETSANRSRIFIFPLPLDVILVSRSWQDVAQKAYPRVMHAVRLTVQVAELSLLPSGLVPLLAVEHTRRVYLERTIPRIVIADMFINCQGSGTPTHSQTSLIPTMCLQEYVRYLAARQAPFLPQSILSTSQVQAPPMSTAGYQITIDMLGGLSDTLNACKRERMVYDTLSILRHPANALHVYRHKLDKHRSTALQRIQLGAASAESWVELQFQHLSRYQSVLNRLWLLDGGASLGYTPEFPCRFGPDMPRHFYELATTCVAFSVAARGLGSISRLLLDRVDSLALVCVHNLSVLSLHHHPVDLPSWPYEGQCGPLACLCSLLQLWNLPRTTFDTVRPPSFVEVDSDAWLAIRHLHIIRHNVREDVDMTIEDVRTAIDAIADLIPEQRAVLECGAEHIQHDVDMMSTIYEQWQVSLDDTEDLDNGGVPFTMTAAELEYPDPTIVLLRRLTLRSRPHLLGFSQGVVTTYTPAQRALGKLTINHFDVYCE